MYLLLKMVIFHGDMLVLTEGTHIAGAKILQM